MKAERGKNVPRRDRGFDNLSSTERAVVGSGNDYDWEAAVDLPARERPEMRQVSLRLDGELYDSVLRLAEEQRLSFSDVARSALRTLVGGGETSVTWNPVITYGFSRLLVSVPGHVPEMPASRRHQQPDERTPPAPEAPLSTVASG